MVKIIGTEFEKDEIFDRLANRLYEYSGLLRHPINIQLYIFVEKVYIARLTIETGICLNIARRDERAYIKYNMRFNSEE